MRYLTWLRLCGGRFEWRNAEVCKTIAIIEGRLECGKKVEEMAVWKVMMVKAVQTRTVVCLASLGLAEQMSSGQVKARALLQFCIANS